MVGEGNVEIGIRRVSHLAVLALILVGLAGCDAGGGTVPLNSAGLVPPAATGGTAPTPAPAPAPAPASAPAPTSAPVSSPAPTGSATVSWTAPSTRVDASPISLGELAGYWVYWGTSASNLSKAVKISGASATSYTLTGLSSGTYYFKVTVYDVNGMESPRSDVASKVIL